jgi:hypothetical protein
MNAQNPIIETTSIWLQRLRLFLPKNASKMRAFDELISTLYEMILFCFYDKNSAFEFGMRGKRIVRRCA